MKPLKLVACTALLLALAAPALAGPLDPPAGPRQVLRAQAEAVTDGDTIRVRLTGAVCGTVIRSLRLGDGADTPERGQPWAAAATARTRELVMGRALLAELTGDVTYNRPVARVWLPDGRRLAAVLVAEGLARVDRRYCGTPWGARLLALEAQARAARQGVWGGR